MYAMEDDVLDALVENVPGGTVWNDLDEASDVHFPSMQVVNP